MSRMTIEAKKRIRSVGPSFFFSKIIIILFVIAFDQITKHLVVLFLKNSDPVVMIPGGLELTYVENYGAAFNSLEHMGWLFIVLTLAFTAVIIFLYKKIPNSIYYRPLVFTLTFLLGGAYGNFIDRITRHYVVDFIYFRVINFPVFNVADIFVTLSVIVLVLLIIFKYKEGDFSFLRKKKDNA